MDVLLNTLCYFEIFGGYVLIQTFCYDAILSTFVDILLKKISIILSFLIAYFEMIYIYIYIYLSIVTLFETYMPNHIVGIM